MDPTPYDGPVPMVTHVHGAHGGPESAGYAAAWWLPNANDIPAGYATKGSFYSQFDTTNTEPGTAVFQYPNSQPEATLWYHDHTLGMTRSNVYAGPAGFWLLRGGTQAANLNLPGPAPKLGDKAGKRYYEIPIAIQDRAFNADGSLFYPDSRAYFGDVPPIDSYTPVSDVSPIHNPETPPLPLRPSNSPPKRQGNSSRHKWQRQQALPARPRPPGRSLRAHRWCAPWTMAPWRSCNAPPCRPPRI